MITERVWVTEVIDLVDNFLVLFTIALPVAVVLGAFIGVTLWVVARIRKQTEIKDKVVAVVFGAVLLSVSIIIGQLVAFWLLRCCVPK